MNPDAPSAVAGVVAHSPSSSSAAQRITRRAEVLQTLLDLRERGSPVVLTHPQGLALPMQLGHVDDVGRRLNLHTDAAQAVPAAMLGGEDLLAVAYLDQARLQFELTQVVQVHGPHGSALQAAMPAELQRIQRRRSWRLPTGGRSGPQVRLRHPHQPETPLTLRVLDVSIGGCALLQPADTPPLPAGLQLGGVQVELDRDTRFSTGITLHVVSTQPDGQGQRLGCEWQQMEGAAQRALQRFIDNAQRRRRALRSGV
jgi:c-di-GMP-binding flagellar brake protein YcgR